eukprot:3115248-Karenia_brevis.AAC.1
MRLGPHTHSGIHQLGHSSYIFTYANYLALLPQSVTELSYFDSETLTDQHQHFTTTHMRMSLDVLLGKAGLPPHPGPPQ